MITKCANQMCGQPFLFFRGGKLFIVDVRSEPQPGNPSTADQAPQKLEHFWLCEQCAPTMTLVVGQGRTPRLISTTCEDPQLRGKRLPRQPHGGALVQAPQR
jgi:hypothetical protein